MTASVNQPTPTAPPEDSVRAALDDPAVRAKLLAHARAVLRGHPADVADAVQEVFRRAWDRRHSFDPAIGSAEGWLFGFAALVFREVFRAAGRRPAQEPDDQALWEKLAVAPVGTDTDTADRRLLVERLLDRLPAEFRAAVELRYLDELDYPEIAGRLTITVVNARMKVCRGLKLLRDLAGIAPGEEHS
jgi:RNA polymerase sigma-70 factor (ECF subfamily)